MDHHDDFGPLPAPRATRCQLLWALAFLVGASGLGWFVTARLLF